MDTLQTIATNDISTGAINKINSNFTKLKNAVETLENGESESGGGESVTPATIVDVAKKTCKIFAHRGNYPLGLIGSLENTLAAIHYAAIQGFDGVEIDPRLCSDNVFILCHNPEIKDVTNVTKIVTDQNDPDYQANQPTKYTVSEITSTQATQLIVCKNSPKYGNQTVPTLEDALKLCYFYGLEVQLDLKNSMEHIDDVIELVFNTGMRGRVYYALNNDVIATGQGQSPDANINYVLSKDSNAKFFGGGMGIRNNERLKSLYNSLSADIKQRWYIYTYTGGDYYHPDDIATIRELDLNLLMLSVVPRDLSATEFYPAQSKVQLAFSHYPEAIQIDAPYTLAQVMAKIEELKPFHNITL